MLLQSLPIEVLHTICYFLTGPDITNLSKCNQALWVVLQDESLWAQLTCDRFPSSYTSTRTEQHQKHDNTLQKLSWQDIYMSKDSLCISAVNDMSITNARLPFWRVVGTRESKYGAIAKLYSICMLDIRGKVEGVPKGQYRIQWRMRFTLSAQWNESLDFTAHVGNEAKPALTYTTPADFYSRQDILTNTWIRITLPFDLFINHRYDTVTLVHGKRTNFWKSGIEIDWARLVPSSQIQDKGLVLEHEYKHWHLDKIASTTAYSCMRRHLGSTNF